MQETNDPPPASQGRLEPGTRAGRYEIKSLLGKGAMGEVYLAHDTELRRNVALKLMLRDDDEEYVRRFRQEARTASALNHPNLLTVFDFGEFRNLHFIVTELIHGETLRHRIARQPLSCIEALDIVIQAGTALGVAHNAGIVHRDIKPENLMITTDGRVKMLDFGLAKLSSPLLTAPYPGASTVSAVSTAAHRIIGTINYMSPEQLRGQPVDCRSDIWSLGIVLFEMIQARRPFEGESVPDVIAAVLERPLPSVTSGRPDVPSSLDGVLEKAISKDREARFATAKEFVGQLHQVREQSELLTTSVVANPGPNAPPLKRATVTSLNQSTGRPRGFHWPRNAAIAIALLVMIVSAVYLARFLRAPAPVKASMRVTPLRSLDRESGAAISPDGRWFVFAKTNEIGQESLQLGQVTVAGSRELIGPGQGHYSFMTFSPDGNWIYFVIFGLKTGTTFGTLCRISILGSARQDLIENVDSAVTFRPDGKQIAFLRTLPEGSSDQLIVSDAEGENLRVLAQRRKPDFFSLPDARQAPDWSPDGKSIAIPGGTSAPEGQSMSVLAIDVQNGNQRFLTTKRWTRVGRVLWSKDGKDLLITASESGTDFYAIYRITMPGGEVSPVVTDLRNYTNLSQSVDGKLMAVATDKSSRIFIAPAKNQTLSNQFANGQMDGYAGLVWAANRNIVYTSMESRNFDLWIKNVHDGTPPRQLTFDSGTDTYPATAINGRYVVFVSNRSGSPHLWRMNLDGTDVRQLTNQSQEEFPQVTPDGLWVIYDTHIEKSAALWKISIDGGEPIQLTNHLASWPALSPDGDLVACLTKEDAIDQPLKLGIFSLKTLKFVHTFGIPSGMVGPGVPAVIRWKPKDNAVSYVATNNGLSNIWIQSMDGGEPHKWTDFTADRIYWFDWSPDGMTVAFARGSIESKVLVIENY